MSIQQQFELPHPPTRVAIQCSGDLTVIGWDQPLVELEAQGGSPNLQQINGQVEIVSDATCTVRLPRATELVEINVGGRGRAQGLNAQVHVRQAQGDLALEEIQTAQIETVGGRLTLQTIAGPVAVSGRVKGDLEAQAIAGDISIQTVGGRLTMHDVASTEVDTVKGDMILHQAQGAVTASKVQGKLELAQVEGEVEIKTVKGDAQFSQVYGRLNCEQVYGRLRLQDVGPVSSGRVRGDLHGEDIHGDLSAGQVRGRVTLDRVAGTVTLGAVAGDIQINDCQGPISATCGGRAELNQIVGDVRIQAGGDIRCRLAEETGANVKAVCAGSLTVETAEETLARGRGAHTLTLGGADLDCTLVAGGSIHLESSAPLVQSKTAGESHPAGADINIDLGELGVEVGGVGARIAAEIGPKAARAIRKTLKKQLREGLRTAARRAAKQEWVDAQSWTLDLGAMANPEKNPFSEVEVELETEEASEPVTEEERLMILRMLENGKITAEEAERLLAALTNPS